MDQKIKELADSFFEWPTEDRSTVTLTSALLFAEHVARTDRIAHQTLQETKKA